MITAVVIGLSLIFLYYWYSDYRRIKNVLSKWIPEVPGVPILGNALDFKKSTNTFSSLSRYSKEYGEVVMVKILLQVVVTADYKLIEFLLGSSKIIEKPVNYLVNWLSTGLLTSSGMRFNEKLYFGNNCLIVAGDKWRKRRHAIRPSFHFKILEQFVDIFASNAKILVKKLENEVGKESIDIQTFISLCTLDNICESAMGVNINAQENSQSTYVKSVKRLCQIISERNFSLLQTLNLTYPLTSNFWEERKLIKYVHNFTNNVIKTRREELKKSVDDKGENNDLGIKKRMAFLDTLFDIKIDGQPLTNEDIREEVDIFMFAGHDTVSTGVSFMLYCLSKHPEVEQRVFEEQRTIFNGDENRNVEWRDCQEMKYLEQVIKETFRLFPPVPLFGRLITEDVTYQDNVIPKGTTILVNAQITHRNPKFFSDPETFDPDRFDSSNERVPPYAFIPFSAGPRNCLGQKFAMIEMKSTLSSILRKFRICGVDGYEPVLRFDLVLKSDNGIRIRLEKR